MNRFDRIFITCTIAFAVFMAVGWIFYLPIFLNPDEDSHYDYALTLFSSGRPMRTDENVVGRDTHPTIEYLMRETHARQQRLDTNVAADPGYGSAAYFRSIDNHAPQPTVAGKIVPAPYISRFYPIGYYALVAVAIAIGDALTDHSIVAQFFSARMLSVFFLISFLWFSWRALCELTLTRKKIRAIFVCTAVLPLTAWMSASVQPDMLACALIAPITFVALRLRTSPKHSTSLALLGLLLASLMATKQHYFAAIYIPIAAMLAARLPWRTNIFHAVASIGWISVPAIVAYTVGRYFLFTTHALAGVCQAPSGLAIAMRNGSASTIHFLGEGLLRGIRTTFVDDSSRSFWTNYTAYRNMPLDIVSAQFTGALSAILPALSMMIALLFLLRLYQVAYRLRRIALRRSWLAAARVATSNILINSYLTFILVIYSFQMYVGGNIPLQGRYWLPFLPAIWYVTFYIAPRALPSRFALPAGNFAFGFVIVFGLLASAYTFPSLHERFYEKPTFGIPTEELTNAIWADVVHGVVRINGVSYDLRSAEPVEKVVLRIDGRNTFLPKRIDRPDVQCDMEKTLLHVGYTLQIDASKLQPGRHEIDVLVLTPWHRGLIDTGTHAEVNI